MNAIHTHRTNFGRVLLRTAGWLLLALTTCAVAQIPSYKIYNLGSPAPVWVQRRAESITPAW